jgi:2-dehydro-3-deoxyphosphogluconate aldolase/(4S)-4-hydroxy-2-oxoglutarate aldolase
MDKRSSSSSSVVVNSASTVATYTALKFIFTRGINTDDVIAYLEQPKIVACGSSWIAKSALIAAGRFDKITIFTREAVNLV